MRSAPRPVRTTLLAAACLVLILALSTCEFPGLGNQSEESGPSLATQEQSLSGVESASGDQGDEGAETDDGMGPILSPLCPTSKNSTMDSGAIMEIKYNLGWAPQIGPEIQIKEESFIFKADYIPGDDNTGTLDFGKIAQQTTIYQIKWYACYKHTKWVPIEFKFTPEIEGKCKNGQININVEENWESEWLLLDCVEGSEVCGQPDGKCDKPIKWYMSFGLGSSSKTDFIAIFNFTSTYEVNPEMYPVPFLGSHGYGGRWVKLEWLP